MNGKSLLYRLLFSLFPFTILTLMLSPVTQVLGQDQIPLNTHRLSERILVTWRCDRFQGTNMTVIATSNGLVIVDTGLSPTMVRGQREMIERELGRSDFRYLINTHVHNDHAFGNEVFPEAIVVSSENGIAAMKKEVELIPDLMARLRNSNDSYLDFLTNGPPDSPDRVRAEEGVASFGIGIADLEAGIEPHYPTLTFTDHHSLDLGDITIELYEFNLFHSEADILILIPEERVLFTGDVFAGNNLPRVKADSAPDFPRLMETWKAILERCPDLETIVPGHSDLPVSVQDFRAMYDYLSELWGDILAAREAGTTLEAFLRNSFFTDRFPEIAHFRYLYRDFNFHQHNIYILWQLAGDIYWVDARILFDLKPVPLI